VKSVLAAVRRLFARLIAEGGAFGGWWVQELRDIWAACIARLAPNRALQFIVDLQSTRGAIRRVSGTQVIDSVEFTVGPNGELPPAEQVWPKGSPRGARAAIYLPPHAVLVCEVALPPVNERELNSVVELQLERKLPLPREALYIDWKVASKAGDDSRRVVAVATRRSYVEELRSGVRAWGWRLTAVRTSQEATHSLNLLPAPTHRLNLQIGKSDVHLLWGAAGLAAMYCATVLGQWLYERTSLDPALSDAKAQLAAIERQRAELASSSAPIAALRRHMHTPSASDAMVAISAAMPPGSWAYQTQIEASAEVPIAIEVEGYSPSAAALVDVLENSARLERVELVQAGGAAIDSNGERFDLKARLLPVDPP
jgi:hypothetical protein